MTSNRIQLGMWSLIHAVGASHEFISYTDLYIRSQSMKKISLTHLPLDNLAGKSHTTFLNACSSLKIFEFRIKFHGNLFLRVQLTVSIGSGNGLAPRRRQAITWTNADPVNRRIYAALGGDELNSHHKTHSTSNQYYDIQIQIHILLYIMNENDICAIKGTIKIHINISNCERV